MSVGRICVRSVDTAELTDSVQTAAQRMHDRNVGTLIVVDKDQRHWASSPIGILSCGLSLNIAIPSKRRFGRS